MEKIYTGKYFRLVDSTIQETRTEHGAGWGAYDSSFILKLQKDVLDTQKLSFQYYFTICDYTIGNSADDHDNEAINVERPVMAFGVLWGNNEFQKAHRDDKFDDESQFSYSYGILDSTMRNYIINHVIIANIVIINPSGKFDVGACRNVYESLEKYLSDFFKEHHYIAGLCDYSTRPSYVKAEEEANREAARADLRKSEAHERALNGGSPVSRPGNLFDGN